MTGNGFTSNNLIEAIRAGRLSGVISALESGENIELPDMHGYSGLPLRTACFEGNLAIVRELLNHGANPNAAASDGPGAPLRLAMRKGHQDIVDLLLQAGAMLAESVEIPPEEVDTPIDPFPAEVVAPSLPESEPSNIIEFSPPSLTPPTNEAILPELPESKPGNLIEFSSSDILLPIEDADMSSHFGTDTSVLSMDLLFLEENETPSVSPQATDKP